MTLAAAATRAASGKVQQVLRDVEQLEPLPASLTRLLRALDDPDVNVRSVSDMIQLDPSLAANVLRLANSALLGYGPACATVPDAVMRLGLQRIRALVLGARTATLLGRPLVAYGLAQAELLNHSITTAAYARQVAVLVCLPDVEIAYLAGLLHDMGKLVLEKYVRVDYDQVRRLVQQHNLRLWQAEEKLFGLDHAAVGGLMASRWQFPAPLVEAIKCHHWPSFAAVEPRLAAVVNVADSLAPRRQAGGLSHAVAPPHPEALRLLNLDEKRLERLRAETPGVAR